MLLLREGVCVWHAISTVRFCLPNNDNEVINNSFSPDHDWLFLFTNLRELISPHFSSVYFAENGRKIKTKVSWPLSRILYKIKSVTSPSHNYKKNISQNSFVKIFRIKSIVSIMVMWLSISIGQWWWIPAKDLGIIAFNLLTFCSCIMIIISNNYF